MRVMIMSKYTTQLRYICEQKAGRTESVDYSGINDVITQSAPLIFGNFPIFDEAYRSVLETKIIKHYYTREICEETVGLWQLRLNTRMNEIMPYYNKLYQSELLEFNPLEDYRMETTRNINKEGNETGEKEKGEHTTYGSEKSVDETYNDSLKQTGTDTLTQTGTDKVVQTHNDTTEKDGTQHTTGTQWEMFSATPQGTLNNVENETYLTSATKNTNNTTVTNEETTENNGGYTSTDTKNLTNTDTKNLTNTGTGTKNKGENIEGSNDKTSNENATKQITNTEEYVESKHGKIGTKSYAKMLMEFRESLLNIDKMIIDELSDLFMLIW